MTQRLRVSHRRRCSQPHPPGTAAMGQSHYTVTAPQPRKGFQAWPEAHPSGRMLHKMNPRILAPRSPLELVWAVRIYVRKRLTMRTANDHSPIAWAAQVGAGLRQWVAHPRSATLGSDILVSKVEGVGRQYISDFSPPTIKFQQTN